MHGNEDEGNIKVVGSLDKIFFISAVAGTCYPQQLSYSIYKGGRERHPKSPI